MSTRARSLKKKNVYVNCSIGRNVFQKIAILLCLTFVLVGDCYAVDNNSIDNISEIKYGYPNQSIFVATINDKEQPVTPMLSLARELFARANLSWHATSYPASRLFQNLRNGTTNFSILVRASSLLESCVFSKSPVYSTNLNIYYIGDKPPIATKEDLVGSRVITIRGYSYGNLLKFMKDPTNKITNVVANTHSSAFGMLKLGRADYLLDYASAADDIISASSISELRSTTIDELNIFLVLSKSYPNADELMKKLEKIMESIDVNKIVRRSSTKTAMN